MPMKDNDIEPGQSGSAAIHRSLKLLEGDLLEPHIKDKYVNFYKDLDHSHSELKRSQDTLLHSSPCCDSP
ncbi:hypothetical protein TNCT_643241 [Trichonephila clavata]|uniref:Uncharacterized protein n=1 Tax=Trichonephila clavata TaxID=2740835 RepID=A0A8X6LTF8_TRICU|nr:hypothetical protein TNCT_643241 [Trichonephila clavata]